MSSPSLVNLPMLVQQSGNGSCSDAAECQQALVGTALREGTLTLEDLQMMTQAIAVPPSAALSGGGCELATVMYLKFSERVQTVQGTPLSLADLILEKRPFGGGEWTPLDVATASLTQLTSAPEEYAVSLGYESDGGEELRARIAKDALIGAFGGLVDEATLVAALSDCLRPEMTARVTTGNEEAPLPPNTLVLEFSEPVVRVGGGALGADDFVVRVCPPADAEGGCAVIGEGSRPVFGDGRTAGLRQVDIADEASSGEASSSRRALSEAAAEGDDAGVSRLAFVIEVEGQPAGETVSVDTVDGRVADLSGNTLPLGSVAAGRMSGGNLEGFDDDNSLGGIEDVVTIIGTNSTCEDSTADFDAGLMIGLIIMLVHGLLHAAGPLLPYASAAWDKASKFETLGKSRETKAKRRAAAKWGPCVWLCCAVLSVAFLPQRALGVLLIPWIAALWPLWALYLGLAFAHAAVCRATTKSRRHHEERTMPPILSALHLLLHLAVALVADELLPEPMIVLSVTGGLVAVAQLVAAALKMRRLHVESIALRADPLDEDTVQVTRLKAKIREKRAGAAGTAVAVANKRKAILAAVFNLLGSWAILGALLYMNIEPPVVPVACGASLVWAILPLALAVALLLLHQLYLLLLWRCLKPPPGAVIRRTPGAKDVLRAAFASQMTYDGAPTTEAAVLLREVVAQAVRQHRPLSEMANELFAVASVPPVWVELGKEFVKVNGFTPHTDAEVLNFARSLIDDAAAAERAGSAALRRFEEDASAACDRPATKAALLRELKAALRRGADELPQALRLAAEREYRQLHDGQAPASDEELMTLLKKLVDALAAEDGGLATTALPPGIRKALMVEHVQLMPAAALPNTDDMITMLMRKASEGVPSGVAAAAAAAGGALPPPVRMPEGVLAAVTKEFAAQKQAEPANEAEAVAFLKEMMSAAAATPRGGGVSLASSSSGGGAAIPLPEGVMIAIEQEFANRGGIAESAAAVEQLGKQLVNEYEAGKFAQQLREREEALGSQQPAAFGFAGGAPPAMPMPDGLMDLMETTKAFDQITDQALTAPETTEQVTLMKRQLSDLGQRGAVGGALGEKEVAAGLGAALQQLGSKSSQDLFADASPEVQAEVQAGVRALAKQKTARMDDAIKDALAESLAEGSLAEPSLAEGTFAEGSKRSGTLNKPKGLRRLRYAVLLVGLLAAVGAIVGVAYAGDGGGAISPIAGLGIAVGSVFVVVGGAALALWLRARRRSFVAAKKQQLQLSRRKSASKYALNYSDQQPVIGRRMPSKSLLSPSPSLIYNVTSKRAERQQAGKMVASEHARAGSCEEIRIDGAPAPAPARGMLKSPSGGLLKSNSRGRIEPRLAPLPSLPPGAPGLPALRPSLAPPGALPATLPAVAPSLPPPGGGHRAAPGRAAPSRPPPRRSAGDPAPAPGGALDRLSAAAAGAASLPAAPGIQQRPMQSNLLTRQQSSGAGGLGGSQRLAARLSRVRGSCAPAGATTAPAPAGPPTSMRKSLGELPASLPAPPPLPAAVAAPSFLPGTPPQRLLPQAGAMLREAPALPAAVGGPSRPPPALGGGACRAPPTRAPPPRPGGAGPSMMPPAHRTPPKSPPKSPARTPVRKPPTRPPGKGADVNVLSGVYGRK